MLTLVIRSYYLCSNLNIELEAVFTAMKAVYPNQYSAVYYYQ